MASPFPSAGDILMLSQNAWKLGRAFTKGTSNVPTRFAEVEREANGLSEALKNVGETLLADDRCLRVADPNQVEAFGTMLESAVATLADLESCVDRYKVTRKKETNGGFTVERVWSEDVLANYKAMRWTGEGGDMTDLRNLLHLHANAIDLTMQVLQTKSQGKIERTIVPMAHDIVALRDQEDGGDLSDRIDHAMNTIGLAAKQLMAPPSESDYGSETGTSRNNSVASSLIEQYRRSPWPVPPSSASGSTPGIAPGTASNSAPGSGAIDRRASEYEDPATGRPRSNRRDSTQPTPLMKSPSTSSRNTARTAPAMDWDFESGLPPVQGELVPRPLSITMRTTPSSSEAGPSRRSPHQVTRKESGTLPKFFESIPEGDAEQRQGSTHSLETRSIERPRARRDSSTTSSSIMSKVSSRARGRQSLSSNGSYLPPPAMALENGEVPSAATPSSIFKDTSPRHTSNFTYPLPSPTLSAHSRAQFRQSPHPDKPTPPTRRNSTFERHLFRNAAILSDSRGVQIEYASHIPNEPDARFNTEMKDVCGAARICVIRKRENREHGGTQAFTSIWALSDDGTVRCQQKLPETTEVVPYCSYFENTKISIPPPTPAESLFLRLHGANWSDFPYREIKTNWINYFFDTAADADAFQSAIFGRKLLGSFHTSKTTVIHEGLKGAFALEEQFANIEMLRLWEDDGLTTPNAQGGVMALMHMSSNFGTGWARWWMNSNQQQTRVKDDGYKWVKVKGIDISVIKPGGPERGGNSKPSPVKKVTGVRLEFSDHLEKGRFLDTVREVQGRLLRLPSI